MKRGIFKSSAALLLVITLIVSPIMPQWVVNSSAAQTYTYHCTPAEIVMLGREGQNGSYWIQHKHDYYFSDAAEVIDPIDLNIDDNGNYSVTVPENRQMTRHDPYSSELDTRGVVEKFTLTGQFYGVDSFSSIYAVSYDDYESGLFGGKIIGYRTKTDTQRCSPSELKYTVTEEGVTTQYTLKVKSYEVITGKGVPSQLADITPPADSDAYVEIYLKGDLYDSDGKIFKEFLLDYYYFAKNSPKKPVQDAKDGTLLVSGDVKNGMNEDMRGLDMTAELISASNPNLCATEVNTSTSRFGSSYNAKFTVPAALQDPAVRITLRLNYLAGNRKMLIYFIDAADNKSAKDEFISVTYIKKLSEREIESLKNGGKVSILCQFRFAGLLSKWKCIEIGSTERDYTTNLTDKITVKTSSGSEVLTDAERLFDASILYSAAVDAHRVASENLGEEENMKRAGVAVYLRSPNVEDPTIAHYDSSNYQVHMGADTSFHNDDSIFTILHEFGHAVDHLTSGNANFHLNRGTKNGVVVDKSHYGIFNPTMNDSYMEGFASFYAGMVKNITKRSNPEKLERLDLSFAADNYAYKNAWIGFSYEEAAIATFLYNSYVSIGDDMKFWSALSPDRTCFKDYYDAVMNLMDNKKKEFFTEAAEGLGLNTMPYPGNGVFDEGEPFLDENDNGKYDKGEPYYDLIYKWNYYEDIDLTLKVPDVSLINSDKKRDIVYGRVADYDRSERYSTPMPEIGYLSVGAESGVELPDYYLVKIDIPGDTTYTSLRRRLGSHVFLFDPNVINAGEITVSIPGGSEIFEGDIGEISKKAIQRGRDFDAAMAYITKDKLPAEGSNIITVPTYGAPDAKGYIDGSSAPSSSGDIDGDGDVTANDALIILRASVGLDNMTDDQKATADMDSDGYITANDALAVLRISADLNGDNANSVG